MDLETSAPPRNTSRHGARVDYVLCSPALKPRIRRDQTRLHLVEVGSDHKALVGNIRFNRSKLLIGIKGGESGESARSEMERRMGALGRARVTFTQDLASVHRKLSGEDTVIVESPNVERILPSLDVCFQFSDGTCRRQSPAGDNRIIYIPNVEDMFSVLDSYLA